MTTSNQFGFRVLLIVLLTFVSFEITLGQDANETALQTIVDETVDQNELVGLSVAVYNPTDGLTQAAAGVSVAGSDVDLSPQDMMYAGSVTKTFVSAAILQLVEEGELSLDDTLDMFFPDYPHADAITIRQMLGMTSGTFDYFRNAPDNPFIPVLMTDITYEWTPDEIIATAGSIAQPAVPGETYTYSNTDYILLGRIIEMTTGNDLHTELRQRLFTPLGMESVYMAGVENVPTEIAQGFVRDSAFLFGSEEPITTPRQAYVGLETLSWAAGGLVTHSGDLAVGMHGLLSGDVLSADSLAMMIAPGELVGENGETYGFGVEFYETAAGPAMGHAGSLPGYASLTVYLPDLNLSIAVMTNDEGGEPLLMEVVNAVLETL